MVIFHLPANEKAQINNGLAAGAFLSLSPFLAPATQASLHGPLPMESS